MAHEKVVKKEERRAKDNDGHKTERDDPGAVGSEGAKHAIRRVYRERIDRGRCGIRLNVVQNNASDMAVELGIVTIALGESKTGADSSRECEFRAHVGWVQTR